VSQVEDEQLSFRVPSVLYTRFVAPPAGQDAGATVVIHRDLAIDGDVGNTGRVPARIVENDGIHHPLGVEQRDVGVVSFLGAPAHRDAEAVLSPCRFLSRLGTAPITPLAAGAILPECVGAVKRRRPPGRDLDTVTRRRIRADDRFGRADRRHH